MNELNIVLRFDGDIESSLNINHVKIAPCLPSEKRTNKVHIIVIITGGS